MKNVSTKKLIKNKNGQALIEFFLFFPMILLMYSALIRIGSAINGSINQQKVTRGYFFARMKGNSTVPSLQSLQGLKDQGITSTGLWSIGWRDYEEGIVPYAPCYAMNPLAVGMKEGDDKCQNPPGGEKRSSNIRVRTMYGICSARYDMRGDIIIPIATSSSRRDCSTQ